MSRFFTKIFSIFLFSTVLCGCGILYYQDGTVYIKRNNPNFHAIGSGIYKDNIKNGKGEIYWDNGDSYVGDLKNGLMHGKGTLILSGDKYIGDFVDNAKHGFGIYYYTTGEVYKGEFRKDKSHIRGMHTWPDGTSREYY